MRITIVRHGQPDFEWKRSVKGSDFRRLEAAYNAAGILGQPPDDMVRLVDEHALVVCSDLPRSIASAQALGASTIHVSSPLFREMSLPYFDSIPIKMPLNAWAAVLRIMWILGFSKNAESFSTAKKRARTASQQLAELATKHETVLFVGHGFLNHYVAKALLADDWNGPRSPGKNYWEYGVYQRTSAYK